MNETTCVVMNTYFDVMDGEKTETEGNVPKWIGSDNIRNVLNEIISKLDNINENVNKLTENKEKLKYEYDNYTEYKENKENEIKTYKVTNPGLSIDTNNEKVEPIYVYGREAKVNDYTSNNLQEIVESIDTLTDQVKYLKDDSNINDVRNKLYDAIDKIEDITNEFSVKIF